MDAETLSSPAWNISAVGKINRASKPKHGLEDGLEKPSRHKCNKINMIELQLAETEGFEPSVPDLPVRRFSKPLVSATHPRLRIAAARAGYSGGLGERQGGRSRNCAGPALPSVRACWTMARAALP